MILKNKIAIVTGAGQGIGRGIALALAKEGCNVVVGDINKEEGERVAMEIQKMGVKSLAVKCDVSDKKEVDYLMTKTVEELKGLDILVNNAGIYPFVPFLEMKESEWEKVLNINLKSVFLCSQAAANRMENGGKIVNISSIASLVGFESLTHYCASKGGINALIRAMALELAPKKINVNAIAPGVIDTPGASATSNEEVKNQTIAAIPLQRMGLPQDIANAVVFLVSDRADYITGQTIIVDGGYTLR